MQQAFVAELRSSGKDWNLFGSPDELRALVLRDGFRLQQRGPQPRNLPYTSLGTLFKGREQTSRRSRNTLSTHPIGHW